MEKRKKDGATGFRGRIEDLLGLFPTAEGQKRSRQIKHVSHAPVFLTTKYDVTDPRIGCTHALIPNRMCCIPFNARR